MKMKMNLKYILPLFLFLLTDCAMAREDKDDKEIKLEVEAPKTVRQGEPFRLIYKLSNAEAVDIDFPDRPDGFEVLYGPATSNSSSMRMVDGKRIFTLTGSFNYTLVATRSGKLRLPQASVQVNGKEYKSGKTEIEVTSAGIQAPEDDKSKKKNKKQDQRFEIKDKDAFVKTEVEETEIEGEKAFEITIRLYTAKEVDGLSLSGGTDPDLSDFHILRTRTIPVRRIYQDKYQGRDYYVADLRKILVMPKRSGKIQVDGGSADVVFRIKTGEVEDSFWGPVEKEISIEKTFIVEPFTIDAGLVGDWQAV